MAQLDEMAGAEPQSQALNSENRRLQVLVGELLKTNQELRFKVEELEKQTESAECGHVCANAVTITLAP